MNNPFSTLFGLMKDGTSWTVDVLQTVLWVMMTLFILDILAPDSMQEGMPIVANTLIFVPTILIGYYVWGRAREDNRARKALRRVPALKNQINAAVGKPN
jgi:hypothetical protein